MKKSETMPAWVAATLYGTFTRIHTRPSKYVVVTCGRTPEGLAKLIRKEIRLLEQQRKEFPNAEMDHYEDVVRVTDEHTLANTKTIDTKEGRVYKWASSLLHARLAMKNAEEDGFNTYLFSCQPVSYQSKPIRK